MSPFAGLTAEDRAAVARAAARADVERFLDRATDELSGGEWQRVRVARALAQGGRALVLDERGGRIEAGLVGQIRAERLKRPQRLGLPAG